MLGPLGYVVCASKSWIVWCNSDMRHYLAIRFDADLNAAKDEANAEMLAKEKLAREKDTLQTEFNELQEKFKVGSLSLSC